MVMEKVIQFVFNLFSNFKICIEFINLFLSELWYIFEYFFLMYVGEKFQYCQVDGLYNVSLGLLYYLIVYFYVDVFLECYVFLVWCCWYFVFQIGGC